MGDFDQADAVDHLLYEQRIATWVEWMAQRDLCPLILGGDHSITYAPVAALQQTRDICLIWLDAHTDFSPWQGAHFHNHKQVLRRIAGLTGVRRIVQIGYRGVTTGDERHLCDKCVVVPTSVARQLDEQALLALVPTDLPCYVSIDIDVIDPFVAPGTSSPVPDGIGPLTVKNILRALVNNRRIVGVDMVEVNPILDQDSATADIAADLLAEIAQHWSRQQSVPPVHSLSRARLPAGSGDERPPFAPDPNRPAGLIKSRRFT